jgi:hypothetical protein
MAAPDSWLEEVRAALIDRRFTDYGAATAYDTHGAACVVVMLAAWPRLIGTRRGSTPLALRHRPR